MSPPFSFHLQLPEIEVSEPASILSIAWKGNRNRKTGRSDRTSGTHRQQGRNTANAQGHQGQRAEGGGKRRWSPGSLVGQRGVGQDNPRAGQPVQSVLLTPVRRPDSNPFHPIITAVPKAQHRLLDSALRPVTHRSISACSQLSKQPILQSPPLPWPPCLNSYNTNCRTATQAHPCSSSRATSLYIKRKIIDLVNLSISLNTFHRISKSFHSIPMDSPITPSATPANTVVASSLAGAPSEDSGASVLDPDIPRLTLDTFDADLSCSFEMQTPHLDMDDIEDGNERDDEEEDPVKARTSGNDVEASFLQSSKPPCSKTTLVSCLSSRATSPGPLSPLLSEDDVTVSSASSTCLSRRSSVCETPRVRFKRGCVITAVNLTWARTSYDRVCVPGI